MNLRTMRLLTILCPLVALLVAGGIVAHQYARRDQLAREATRLEREVARLKGLAPRTAAPAHELDHDGHAH